MTVMCEGSAAAYRSRTMKRWVPFGLFVLVFSIPAFLLAGWLLLFAPQPVWVKLLGSAAITLAGLWNLWRGWKRLGHPRDPPESN